MLWQWTIAAAHTVDKRYVETTLIGRASFMFVKPNEPRRQNQEFTMEIMP